MQIRDHKKIDILLNLLGERYEASHKMRERSQNFAVWILGFGVAIFWILLSGITLTLPQKIIFTAFIVIVGILTKSFLKSMEAGFDKNREVMIKIEQALKLYDKNFYLENTSLFHSEYKDLSKKGTFHFPSLYRWLLTEQVILIFLIWHNSIVQLILKGKEVLYG